VGDDMLYYPPLWHMMLNNYGILY
jgi:hypothetical protein